jgi:pimeloyl-ACP methyl ester carboxylesterase
VLVLVLVSGAHAAAAGGAPIAWQPCPTVSGYQCGTLRVPLDYQDPSRGSVNLAVMERPVPQSKGVIVFNPGGPGESGDLILPILASLMPQAVKEQFTFVSFDERGTGSSEPLLCGPSAGQQAALSPGRRRLPRRSPVWSARAGPPIPPCFRR